MSESSQSPAKPSPPGKAFRTFSPAARNDWILQQRGPRNQVAASTAYAALREWEATDSAQHADVWTVFLTNKECPWRCLMCDLWKNTLEFPLPSGAVVQQLDDALDLLRRQPPNEKPTFTTAPRHLKLYNSGSFFDPQAIPLADHPAIIERAKTFDHLVVECHPSLVGDRILRFQSQLNSAGTTGLEVALGLETAHAGCLETLNKRMTVPDYQEAAGFLRDHQIQIRTFLLVHPPLLREEEQCEWLQRSLRLALDAGSSVVSLIPTRVGNGALDRLAEAGEFREPTLLAIEDAFDMGLALQRGRVFLDLWDLSRFSRCSACFDARHLRLRRMNLSQRSEPRVICPSGCHERRGDDAQL